MPRNSLEIMAGYLLICLCIYDVYNMCKNQYINNQYIPMKQEDKSKLFQIKCLQD